MKFYFVAGIIVISICLVQCVSQNKIAYDFPGAMLPHVKEEYMKQCEKGRILYNINCSGCHTTKVKGKAIIPDFTPEQLKGYELRVTNARHSEVLTDTAVTAEELGIIMTFLAYKKKNASTVASR